MPIQSFQLKGGLFTLTVLYLNSTDLKHFESDLLNKITNSASPDFFKQMPVVVDLSNLSVDGFHLDFIWLKNILLQHGIIPVGIRNVPDVMKEKVKSADWAVFPAVQERQSHNKNYDEPEEKVEKGKEKEEKVAQSSDHNMIECHGQLISQQVRSGQQIVQSQGDLIIVNTVNTGAEVLAGGNIHIYGALKGRALAGIHGDVNARIFCQSLEAELVSIAGKYKVIEDLSWEWRGKSVQIYLENDELKIEQFI